MANRNGNNKPSGVSCSYIVKKCGLPSGDLITKRVELDGFYSALKAAAVFQFADGSSTSHTVSGIKSTKRRRRRMSFTYHIGQVDKRPMVANILNENPLPLDPALFFNPKNYIAFVLQTGELMVLAAIDRCSTQVGPDTESTNCARAGKSVAVGLFYIPKLAAQAFCFPISMSNKATALLREPRNIPSTSSRRPPRNTCSEFTFAVPSSVVLTLLALVMSTAAVPLMTDSRTAAIFDYLVDEVIGWETLSNLIHGGHQGGPRILTAVNGVLMLLVAIINTVRALMTKEGYCGGCKDDTILGVDPARLLDAGPNDGSRSSDGSAGSRSSEAVSGCWASLMTNLGRRDEEGQVVLEFTNPAHMGVPGQNGGGS